MNKSDLSHLHACLTSFSFIPCFESYSRELVYLGIIPVNSVIVLANADICAYREISLVTLGVLVVFPLFVYRDLVYDLKSFPTFAGSLHSEIPLMLSFLVLQLATIEGSYQNLFLTFCALVISACAYPWKAS